MGLIGVSINAALFVVCCIMGIFFGMETMLPAMCVSGLGAILCAMMIR